MTTTTISTKTKSGQQQKVASIRPPTNVHVTSAQSSQAAKSSGVRKSKDSPEARFFQEAASALLANHTSMNMTRGVEKAYDKATRGMPEDARRAMFFRIRTTIDQLAEKIGAAAPVVSPQVRRENNRFMENMKSEADSARKGHIASKKLLPPGIFQEKLGISKQAISKAVKENRLFVVMGPSGENFYPAFFSEEKYDRRTLEKVSKTLGSLPGGSKWQFFTTPKGSLDGRTPLEALATGKIDAVMVAASGFVER